MRFAILAALLVAPFATADVRQCQCDVTKPETLEQRECGLCRETEKQPADAPYFLLKDINPRKVNRTLALPRTHGSGPHELAEMNAGQRAAYWSFAIAEAQKLWGDKWGLAVNGAESRTQCHAHIHIGRLLEGIETSNFVVVDSAAKIPPPPAGGGMWVHPDGTKLHVHFGEIITETVLLR